MINSGRVMACGQPDLPVIPSARNAPAAAQRGVPSGMAWTPPKPLGRPYRKGDARAPAWRKRALCPLWVASLPSFSHPEPELNARARPPAHATRVPGDARNPGAERRGREATKRAALPSGLPDGNHGRQGVRLAVARGWLRWRITAAKERPRHLHAAKTCIPHTLRTQHGAPRRRKRACGNLEAAKAPHGAPSAAKTHLQHS